MPRRIQTLAYLAVTVGCLISAHGSLAQNTKAHSSARPTSTTSPDDPHTFTAQAPQLESGNLRDAETMPQGALAASPNDPTANLTLGDRLLSEHHYPEAMDRFETVLAIDLRSLRARAGELQAATSLALQARNAGNPEAALTCLVHARASLPDDPTLLLDLGIQADQVKQYPLAHDALSAALKLRPGNPATLYALGRLDTDAKDLPGAEQYLRQYLALRPDDASAHFGLGHVFLMAQRIPEARSEFDRSIELQPIQTESYYQLGQIETDLQHDAAARPLLEKVLARNPNHGGALTAMGVLSFRAKEYTAARMFLDRAVARAPDYQPAHYYLGLTLARLGEKSASDEQLKIAVNLAHQAQQNRE